MKTKRKAVAKKDVPIIPDHYDIQIPQSDVLPGSYPKRSKASTLGGDIRMTITPHECGLPVDTTDIFNGGLPCPLQSVPASIREPHASVEYLQMSSWLLLLWGTTLKEKRNWICLWVIYHLLMQTCHRCLLVLLLSLFGPHLLVLPI